MKSKLPKTSNRRNPKQQRSQQTVEAILDAVIRILKREGASSLTTNRIAEVAGVSIGSLYQYFPNKSAIFTALHDRHIQQMDHLIESRLVKHASASLEKILRAIMDAMIAAHSADPELYEMLHAEVPHRAGNSRDFAVRQHGAFKLVLSAHKAILRKPRVVDRAAFIVANMIDAISHAAVLRRPESVSLEDAKSEAVKAILAYLEA